MHEQLDLFSFNTPSYKITKPIRLIEFFAGIGSQAKALKRLGIAFEHHKICEWAIPSIISYNAIHIQNFENECFKAFTKQEMVEWLVDKGVSVNYNEPALKSQLQRYSEDKLRQICISVVNTNNLVDISRVHAEDLEITETDKYDYVLTYSYPCQDLSLAGTRKGMQENSGTRSSLLWEVGRILKELKAINALPKILLMKNVPQCHSGNNIQEWRRWNALLQELGYANFAKDLNSKDYGIPQNRNRCFMISILGDYHYTFPKKHKLKLKLKDMLEQIVDEKYYLSRIMIEFYKDNTIRNKDKGNGFRFAPTTVENAEIAKCITTRAGGRMDDNFIQEDTLLTHGVEAVVFKDLRIRKLTPKECFRLMGFDDEDYEKVRPYQSDSMIYHQAGDSIVVNVLEAIFKMLL